MGGMMSGTMVASMVFSVALALLALAVLVLLIVWLVKNLRRDDRASADRVEAEPAEQVLKRRHARGELTQEEFQRMKQEIS